MNRIIIYIALALIGIGGTWANSHFHERKIVKGYERKIAKHKADSTAMQNLIFDCDKKIFSMEIQDSLSKIFISELQSLTLQMRDSLKSRSDKERVLGAKLAKLEAWKLDAQDGIVTDTIEYRTNIFGKRKRIQ